MSVADGDRLPLPETELGAEAFGFTLSALLDQLGRTIVDVIAGRFDGSRAVTAISIYDPFDDPVPQTGAVLLGVGVLSERALEDFVGHAVDAAASAIVIRELPPALREVVQPALSAGIVVLGLVPGVGWDQVATGMRSALDIVRSENIMPGMPDDGSFEYPAAEFLRAKANALAELLNAPLTIEDTGSRVLAFSGRQDHGDKRRAETILRGRVAADLVDEMKRAGHFARIYASETPVYLDLSVLPRNRIPRVVMRIAAARTVLGSIWVATTGPLSEEHNAILARTATEIATVMELVYKQSGRASGIRRQLVSRLLSGGREADAAATRHELSRTPLVLAVAEHAGGIRHRDEGAQRLPIVADSLHLHLTAADSRNVATLVGGRVFAVMVAQDEGAAAATLRGFLRRPGQDARVNIVVSPAVTHASDLAEAQREVLQTMLVMSAKNGSGSHLWLVGDCYVDVALAEIADRFAAKRILGRTAVAALAAHDDAHSTQYVETLAAYLDHLGNVRAAAEAVRVHHNTLRYRLTRLQEVVGIDLDDAETRFRTMLELRLRAPQTGGG